MLEFVVGIGLAVGAAGAVAGVSAVRDTNVLDATRFESKLDRIAQQTDHECVHCGESVELADIRLLYADDEGNIHVVCDRDACLFAHTQGEHACEVA